MVERKDMVNASCVVSELGPDGMYIGDNCSVWEGHGALFVIHYSLFTITYSLEIISRETWFIPIRDIILRIGITGYHKP